MRRGLLLAALLLGACQSQPTGKSIPSETPTSTQTASSTVTPSLTSSITSTSTRTPTVTITLTPAITLTPTLIPGSMPTLAPTSVQLFFNGSRETPKVALTFDVGEKPELPAGWDEGIYNALLEANAPATFFLGGHWAMRHPDVVRALANNPLFEIGNHSWSHPDMPELTQAEMRVEVVKTNDMLYQLTGEIINLFRFPSGLYDDLSLSVVAYQGMLSIQWDVVTGDPVPDNTADNILRIVQERTQNGSIIIMHANGRGWHTAEALPGMIAWLCAQGYELVTVSELLGLEN